MLILFVAGLSEKAAAQSLPQSQNQKTLQKCKFLFCQALDEDEAGNTDEAVELYSQAVQLALDAVSYVNTFV